MTVYEWFTEWFNNYALDDSGNKYSKGKLSRNSYYSERYRIKHILNDKEFTSLDVSEVSISDIKKFQDNLVRIKVINKTNNEKLKDILISNNTTSNNTTSNANTKKHINKDNKLYSYSSIKSYYDKVKHLLLASKLASNKCFTINDYNKNINVLINYNNLNNSNNYNKKYTLSNKSKKNIIDILRMSFNTLKSLEIIKDNPFDNYSTLDNINVSKDNNNIACDSNMNINNTKVALKEIERDLFLKVAEDSKYFDIYLLLAFSGIRKSEALGLIKSNINIKDKYIIINMQYSDISNNKKDNDDNNLDSNNIITPKSKSSIRIVPISNIEVLEMLNKRISNINDNDFIFSNIDKSIKDTSELMYKDIKELFNICFLLTGNTKYLNSSIHTFRHTYATIFLEKYPNELSQISSILGHSSTSFTYSQYVHLRNEDIDVSKIGERKK